MQNKNKYTQNDHTETQSNHETIQNYQKDMQSEDWRVFYMYAPRAHCVINHPCPVKIF